MTRHDFLIKWGVYTLAHLLVWVLEVYVLARFPLFGIRPVLLPLAAAAVAVLEGASGGAGFGLGIGLLSCAAYPDANWGFVLLFALSGLAAGLLAQYVLRQDFLGCLLCSALSLAALDAVRILSRFFLREEALDALLCLAGREIGISLLFTPLVYLLFLWVFRRVPKRTHF